MSLRAIKALRELSWGCTQIGGALWIFGQPMSELSLILSRAGLLLIGLGFVLGVLRKVCKVLWSPGSPDLAEQMRASRPRARQ